MNKTTPISHLPQQQAVVNSQQELVAGDDDATIQEVLNQITGGSTTGNSTSSTLQNMTSMPTQPQQTHPMPHQIHHQQPATIPLPQLDPTSSMLLNNLMNNPNALSSLSMPNPANSSNNVLNILMFALTEDFKLAVIIIITYVIANFVPVTKVLEKYLSLDKIPYSEILIKGCIVAFLVTLIRKATMK